MRRRSTWVLLAAAYACLCLVAGSVFVERAMERPRRPISARDRIQADALAKAVGAQLEDASIFASDGAIQRGWLLTPGGAYSHTVVVLHGIVANRASMLGPARMFLDHGYRVLAVDMRAHGDSGGEQVTFGALEADDLRRWVASVKGPEGSCVYAFGGSLGGSYALQAADAPGLCAVVAVSADASLREIAFDRIAERLHAGLWVGRTLLRPGVELGFLYARMRYGLDLSGASALTAMARPGVPAFVIHGTDDEITPVRHARLIRAANPLRVMLWIVPGGTHAASGGAEAEYVSRVIGFLEAHRRPWPYTPVLL